MAKARKPKYKHVDQTRHVDQRQDKYRALASDYARARHRKLGPPHKPTIYDLTPEQFTAIKGLGPTY